MGIEWMVHRLDGCPEEAKEALGRVFAQGSQNESVVKELIRASGPTSGHTSGAARPSGCKRDLAGPLASR
jgi:hypothetical protein